MDYRLWTKYKLLSRCTALFMGFALLGSCRSRLYQTEIEKTLYPITQSLPADSDLVKFYQPYKAAIDSQLNTVIAMSASEIVRNRPEGRLNNLVADAMFQTGKQNKLEFDFVHTNYFGLRLPIPAGSVRTRHIFELMPFENSLVTVTLSAGNTKALFDYMAAGGGDPVSGATYSIENKEPRDIRIQGKPLDPNKEYTILTIDYLANGGDKAEVYGKGIRRLDTSIKLRDAILDYIRQIHAEGKVLDPKLDNRVTLK